MNKIVKIVKKIAPKTVISTIIVAACVLGNASYAADLKIATIDLRQAMASSPDAKVVEAKLKKEFTPKEQELVAKEKSFKEMLEKLQRNGAVMSSTERGKLEQDLATKQKDLQRLQMKFQEEFNKRQQEEVQKVFSKVKRAVNEVALKEGLDMVLVNEAVLFTSNTKYEVTQKVIQNLSK